MCAYKEGILKYDQHLIKSHGQLVKDKLHAEINKS